MKFIATADAPPAAGHYSQAVSANGFLFVAGQLPIKRDGSIPDGVDEQTRQALSNVNAILVAAGSSLDRVLSSTVYVSNIELWPDVNRVYSEVFCNHRPARTVAVSPQLHYGALIEVQVIALA